MGSTIEIVKNRIQISREKRIEGVSDLPVLEISERDREDFISRFGKSATMLQCLNLYEEVNRLTKLLVTSDDIKEIMKIGRKLDVFNKIVCLYKNAGDTVNKMSIGVTNDKEESDNLTEVSGIDISIKR